MSLPTLSTLNTTQDTNKQLSQIRSYLVQLKDELESELSNVTYEMLSASLQKRIDAISDDIAVAKENSSINAQMITSDYAKLGSIVANVISAEQINAQNISTMSATVNTINSNYVKSNTLESYMAKTDYLEANNAYIKTSCIHNLNASVITAGTISTDRLNTSAIASATVTSTNICGALNDPRQGTIKVGKVQAETLQMGVYNSSGVLTGYKTLHSTYVTLTTSSGSSTRWWMYRDN